MKDLTKEDYSDYERMTYECRSRSIDAAISVENIISEILIRLFGTEKTKTSIEKYLFSDSLTFDAKIKLFNSLKKNNVFDELINDKFISDDLSYLQKVRNYMAHSSQLINSEILNSYNQKEVHFVSFTEKGTKEIVFYFFNKEDNHQELNFSLNVLFLRRNRTIETLIRTLKKIP
uniref:hypothetical protein n=1 Tax=Flavobacterium sp. TaxID=239 RepID=UPI00404B2D89